ncbi:GNAT family N-acetyltransferase [Sporosarcina sp. A2]|uniref:GNAT family N-acetyltransferase n=1 Tax=Sporosarcina sp. A2 TaxID=3393449 RepID=UPI003D79CFF2
MMIRQLHEQDAKNYRNLRLEALRVSPEAFGSTLEEEKDFPVEKYITRIQIKDSYTYGVFEQHELIGIITLVKEKLMKLSHRANIVAMYVCPEKRDLGIGRDLVNAAIHKARELEGIEQIHLTVVTSNQPARNLYLRLGFEVVGTEKQALKLDDTYYDEDLMVLYL